LSAVFILMRMPRVGGESGGEWGEAPPTPRRDISNKKKETRRQLEKEGNKRGGPISRQTRKNNSFGSRKWGGFNKQRNECGEIIALEEKKWGARQEKKPNLKILWMDPGKTVGEKEEI